jgi:hypothetical protein
MRRTSFLRWTPKNLQDTFLWVATSNEGKKLFIDRYGTIKLISADVRYPNLWQIKNFYWVLAIMPINKFKSMLGKLAQYDTDKMRVRFYRHVKDAHKKSKKESKDLF